MKRNIHAVVCLFLLMVCCSSAFAQSQECSPGSSPSICVPNQNFTVAGFAPNYDSLPCALDGVPYDTVIQFHVPTTADGYTVSSIQILNIVNIPCNMCWASSSSTNTFDGNTTGCIRVHGTTYDAPGQYILLVYANVVVSVPIIGSVTEDDLNIDTVAGLKYYARVAVPGGACIPVDTLANIHYAENAVGTLSAPNISGSNFCSGGNAVLNAASSSYYGYVWSTGAVTSSISVSAAGTYSVTVFGNCTSATASKTISALQSPADSISPATAAVCNGSSVMLTASGGGTYVWSTGSTSPSITVEPSNPTSYSVTVTATNGCTATATKSVSIGSLPTVSVAPTSVSICSGADTTLSATASNGVTYAWSSGSTSDTAHIAAFANTTYKVTVTNTSGCTATSSAAVSVIPLNTTITANGPTTLCGGGSVTLQAAPGLASYLWSDAETTQSITTSAAGTYSCIVTNSSGCTGTSNAITVSIASNLIPVITASNTFNICPGGSTVLSAGVGYSTYSWSLGPTSDSIIATPTSNHTYTVTVTQGACLGTASATVNVANFPVGVSISPVGPITVCNGSNVTLSVDSSYATYHWNNSLTTDSIPVTSSGNYIVTVIENNACSGTASAQVTFTAPPAPVITPAGTQTICNGGSVTFDAGIGYLSYMWSTGDTSEVINIVSAGTYTVTVGEIGCTGSAANPVVVAVSSTPMPGITPATTNICAGQSATLTVDSSYSSYLWSNGATSQSISVDTTGTYAVTVTANGCPGSSTQPVVVYVNAFPEASVTELGTASGFTEIQAGPANASYQWLVQQTPGGAYTVQSVTSGYDTVVCSTVPAYYSVVAIQNNCADTSASVEVICTGLGDISSLLSFTIQPNPAKDLLYVNYELTASTDVHLSVIDMTGQKVADIVNTNEAAGLHKHYIAVSNFAPGVYLLNFMTDSGSFNTKFVKQ